ncbi:hypothetical protein H109_00520 [Trichophyton interdigitale MR816]|uniref:Uncharacterized protein n=1 Tax=Trichophyton interdigitale (strain MR816) TaxID=1215338 RepID=A0A059JIN1_TRIIM|nr:hypothetical protein H101_01772 [Trichophyton interdigitale H6]KDB27700.1 hypothetical protein H109_00520 [Trichophyton interdigitale MR816]
MRSGGWIKQVWGSKKDGGGGGSTRWGFRSPERKLSFRLSRTTAFGLFNLFVGSLKFKFNLTSTIGTGILYVALQYSISQPRVNLEDNDRPPKPAYRQKHTPGPVSHPAYLSSGTNSCQFCNWNLARLLWQGISSYPRTSSILLSPNASDWKRVAPIE